MRGLILLFKQAFKRELLIQTRQLRYLVNTCLFFLMILFLFPLTMSPDPIVMKSVAPGLIWMALLLCLLLSSERLFQQDYENGVMEQWLVSGQSLTVLTAAKITAHWVYFVVPILTLCPVIALVFNFNLYEFTALIMSLLCGTPALLFLCALAASFGVGVNQRGALMALILLPLTLPLLVFGSGTINNAIQSLPINSSCALLLAFSILSVVFLPTAIATIIKICHVD